MTKSAKLEKLEEQQYRDIRLVRTQSSAVSEHANATNDYPLWYDLFTRALQSRSPFCRAKTARSSVGQSDFRKSGKIRTLDRRAVFTAGVCCDSYRNTIKPDVVEQKILQNYRQYFCFILLVTHCIVCCPQIEKLNKELRKWENLLG